MCYWLYFSFVQIHFFVSLFNCRDLGTDGAVRVQVLSFLLELRVSICSSLLIDLMLADFVLNLTSLVRHISFGRANYIINYSTSVHCVCVCVCAVWCFYTSHFGLHHLSTSCIYSDSKRFFFFFKHY